MFDLFNLILFNFSKFFSFFHSTGVIKYLEIFYFYQIIYELIKTKQNKVKKNSIDLLIRCKAARKAIFLI